MKTKPILFNTEMVCAILAGRKTQTRRLVKLTDKEEAHEGDDGWALHVVKHNAWGGIEERVILPRNDVGNILWVRETWQYMEWASGGKYAYKAGGGDFNEDEPWKPSIHMPREAARIFLRVKGVYFERLQDITVADVIAEGVMFDVPLPIDHKDYNFCAEMEAFGAFACLWDSVSPIGYKWLDNPWVEVVKFEVITKEEAKRYE